MQKNPTKNQSLKSFYLNQSNPGKCQTYPSLFYWGSGGLASSCLFYNDFNAFWIHSLFGISLALSLLPENFLSDSILLVQRNNFAAVFGHLYA